jgi:hypothetical protein
MGVISNYPRYHSRYRLFREWYAKMLATPNVKVYVVEAAFGDRAHEVTSASNPTHLQVRTNSELWIKENLLNLGARHLLPRDWRFLAWVDADVEFREPGWAMETMQQLQHFPIVQPWQSAVDLGPYGQIMSTFSSFGWQTQRGQKVDPNDSYAYAHTGYAWACRRDFWEAVGGLFDCAILGSADYHMAWACLGKTESCRQGEMQVAGMRQRCLEWQARAVPITHREVGYASGRIEHSFHGSKAKRAYLSRWQLLLNHGFNPITDLKYDAQGVLQLVGKPALEAAIRQYNRTRDEDSTSE